MYVDIRSATISETVRDLAREVVSDGTTRRVQYRKLRKIVGNRGKAREIEGKSSSFDMHCLESLIEADTLGPTAPSFDRKERPKVVSSIWEWIARNALWLY